MQNGNKLNIIKSYGSLMGDLIEAAARGQIFADNCCTLGTIKLFAHLKETLTQEARDALYAKSAKYPIVKVTYRYLFLQEWIQTIYVTMV
jgi:hypothetical protein